MHTQSLLAGGLLALLTTGVFADDIKITVKDAYARSSNPKVAAAFMELVNQSGADDRLLSASSDVAKRVELHTHRETDGIMKMIHVEEGFALPDGEITRLERGGRHVMFLGLSEPLENGDEIKVTLTFEKAGDVTLRIPVDNDRKASHGAHGHKTHGQGHSGHGG